MATTDLNALVSQLSVSADALAALGAALAARVTGIAPDPLLRPRIDETLEALGVRDAVSGVPTADLAALLGRLKCYALTNAKLISGGSQTGTWRHVEPEILEAAGDATAGFADQLKARIAPQLDGLSARLATPEAAFLDIGVGVAALSIGMARAWPSLSIVGIDPLPQAIALARKRVLNAGFQDRIRLREQTGETLKERRAFDLVWLPSLFIPETAISAVIERAQLALKPGGWLLIPTMRQDRDTGDLTAAVARLRIAMFGGTVTTGTDLAGRLRGQGLTDVRVLPSPPGAMTALLVGRQRP